MPYNSFLHPSPVWEALFCLKQLGQNRCTLLRSQYTYISKCEKHKFSLEAFNFFFSWRIPTGLSCSVVSFSELLPDIKHRFPPWEGRRFIPRRPFAAHCAVFGLSGEHPLPSPLPPTVPADLLLVSSCGYTGEGRWYTKRRKRRENDSLFKGTVSRDGFGILRHVLLVLGLNRGRSRSFFKYFSCSNYFLTQSAFLAVNASCLP
jgi:hypothetical protein